MSEESEKLEEIGQELKKLNDTQTKISDIIKRQDTKQLKEETQADDGIDKNIKNMPSEISDGISKEFGFLRKTFDSAFSGISNFLSPGGLLKSFGLLSGSPIFLLLGDKLEGLTETYKEHRESSKKDREESLRLQKERNKNAFLEEQLKEEEFTNSKKQTELLNDINEKEFSVADDDKKGGLMGLLALPFQLLSGLIPASIFKAFSDTKFGKIFTKIFSPVGNFLKNLFPSVGKLGGMGKILGTAAKGLGKFALPLTIILGVVDFIKGFFAAEEITGKTGLISQIQGGLASVVAGFTFGLIDIKKIHKVLDRIKTFFLAPVEMLIDFVKGEKPIGDILAEYVSGMTAGFISSDAIKNGVKLVTDSIVGFFTAPFKFIKDIFTGDQPILKSISDYVSSLTFNIISSDTIKKGIDLITEKVIGFFLSPGKLLADIWSSDQPILKSISDYVSSLTFNIISQETIEKGISFLSDKILTIFKNPFSTLKNIIFGINFKDIILNTLSGISFGLVSKDTLDEVTGFLFKKISDIIISPLTQLMTLKDKVLNIVNNSFSFIKEQLANFKFGNVFEDMSEIITNISFGDLKESLLSIKDKLKEKITSILNLIKNPFKELSESIFGTDETGEKGFFSRLKEKISTKFSSDLKIESNIKSTVVENQIKTVKKESVILKTIETEFRQDERRNLEKKVVRKDEVNEKGNIFNNVNNNTILPQEDMSTRTDDTDWRLLGLQY